MGGGKLLWLLLGIGLLVLAAAKSAHHHEEEEENDLGDELEEEEEDDDELDDCPTDCQRNCQKLNCATGFERDRCGCCACKLAEGGTAPKIVSDPQYIKNTTGGSAALSCEVIGDPIPFVSWLKTDVDNNTAELPGDDNVIMTLTQGGPEKHEITAWLQIMSLRKDHEGDYSCVAFNKHGTAKKTARLKVQKKHKKKHHHHHKKE